LATYSGDRSFNLSEKREQGERMTLTGGFDLLPGCWKEIAEVIYNG
jgi:hypothetical protein